ncbi:MAG: TlpA family protein disulfide reductase [Bacteroidales bacterium]|jgi:peroxiredoxin|nr:TlpA family protein disulfide reductase [Bacteroidales bacterium]
MRLKKYILLSIILIIPAISLYAQKGYEVSFQMERQALKNGAKTRKPESIFRLVRFGWNKNTVIDSVKTRFADGKAKIIFRGKTDLVPGEYKISCRDGQGNKIEKDVNFFVSSEGKVKERIIAGPSGIKQVKGSKENEIYFSLQDYLNEEKPSEIKSTLKKFWTESSERCPNSLLHAFLKYTVARRFSFDSTSIYSIASEIGLDDRLLNTSFGGNFIKSILGEAMFSPVDSIIRIADSLLQEPGGNNNQLNTYKSAAGKIIFDFFRSPRIMGEERVAFYVAEKYFLTGRLQAGKNDYFVYRSYVKFNEHSLIGMKAPELKLRDLSGKVWSLKALCSTGEYTVIFFYTNDCIECKKESPKLIDFLNSYEDGIINVFAVYTESDTTAWKKYAGQEFEIYNPFINWINVADKDYKSNFAFLYGVISTPRIFLLDGNGIIIGRNLDTESLKNLLKVRNERRNKEYEFFDGFFSGNKDIHAGIDEFYKRSISDTSSFREIFGELYNYLKNSDSYDLQEGAAYLGEKYIVNKACLWKTNPEYVSKIKRAIKVFNMNRLGSRAENLTLSNEVGAPVSIYDIKSKYKVLFFYSTSCQECISSTKIMKALYEKAGKAGIEFLGIYTGTNYGAFIKFITENNLKWVNLWNKNNEENIFGKYALLGVPSIYILDRNNIVVAKDISPATLSEIIKKKINKDK